MRPLRLELEGFTSFRNPVCLDLADLDLFAITGPTGAGKSSLIDAVAYALYGRVPRVTAEVGAVISQGLDRMRVTLEFLAGEERYRVYRETRRKGAPNVRLDRWRDGDWQPQLDRAREVTERIEQIVGLDYDGFTRSVLLPQGQFQEFLAGSAEKRRAVLGSLLRLDVYNRMRSRATSMAAEMKTRLDERERTLEALADATPENLKRLEGELEAGRLEAKRLHGQSKALALGLEQSLRLTGLRTALVAAEAEHCDAEAKLQDTRNLIEQGDTALEEATSQLADLQVQLTANCYDPDRLTQLTLARERAAALEEACRQREAALASHKTSEASAANAEKAVAIIATRVEAAEAATRVADAALEESRRHNLAATLAGGLKPGDPCPICGGKVGELPAFDRGSLETAERAHQSARKMESEARSSLQNATNAATRATMALETSQRRLAEAEEQTTRLRQALSDALGAAEALSLDAIDGALRQQTLARRQREALQAELDRVSTQRQQLATQIEGAREHLSDLDARLAEAAEATENYRHGVAVDVELLQSLASEQCWQDVVDALGAASDVTPLLRGRAEAAQDVERAAAVIVGQLEARLERLRQDVERAKTLRHGLAALKKEHDVAADLAQMLRADRFQAYIQQEALATLAADGSRRLDQLSAGRYRLQVDDKGQEFEVIDQWNADAPRSVRTLSGGETFLASLALALSLAESLPSLAAGRRIVLDSVFLDEGFGSLDTEALDRAADALDALRHENRMVCIVTHLPELANRLPARVVVTKSETGSTVAIA
jgi:exonuclease SbcC